MPMVSSNGGGPPHVVSERQEHGPKVMNRRARAHLQILRRLLTASVAGLLAFGLFASAAGAQSDPTPTRKHPLRVLFMGDSLALESRDYFDFVLGYSGRAEVDDSLVFGGTAICDWLEKIGPKLKEFKPDIAVVEFAGNAFTNCMQDPATGKPYADLARVSKYWTDANEAMETFSDHGVFVYWVNPPAGCRRTERPMTSVFIRIASRWDNAAYIDADGALNPDGTCTTYLPCLDGEPCTATDPETGERASIVRAPDGVHFCPDATVAVAGVNAECDVYSSGAYRYATAVAVPIIQQYELTPPTAPLVPLPSALPRRLSGGR